MTPAVILILKYNPDFFRLISALPKLKITSSRLKVEQNSSSFSMFSIQNGD